MGVLTLDSYIRKSYPTAIKYYRTDQKISGKYGCFGIDANPLIYNAVYTAFDTNTNIPMNSHLSYDEKISLVFQYTWDQIEYICNMVDSEEVYIAFDGTAPAAKMTQQRNRRYCRPLPGADGFDLSLISTGTNFMRDLSIYIKFKIHGWNNKKVIYSSYNVGGEGEHKIMDYFRSLPPQKVCMFGPDGDLIMLGLGSKMDFTLLKSDLSNVGRYYTIDMNILRDAIQDVDTFVFLGFLLGNDFIPRLEIFHLFYSGIGDLYKYVKEPIIKDNHILLDNFKNLLSCLEKEEWNLIKKRTEYKWPMLEESSNFEEFRRRYYKEWAHEEDIKSMCHRYLDMLWWTWLYYKKGCPTFDFQYKWHYPPFLFDICHYIEDWRIPVFIYKGPVTPFEQLVRIMPPSRKYLLPKKYHHYFDDMPDPSTIKKNIDGRHPTYDPIWEVPFFNQDVKIKHRHRRNLLSKDRVFTKGKKQYIYTCKFGQIKTFIDG